MKNILHTIYTIILNWITLNLKCRFVFVGLIGNGVYSRDNEGCCGGDCGCDGNCSCG